MHTSEHDIDGKFNYMHMNNLDMFVLNSIPTIHSIYFMLNIGEFIKLL